MEVQEFRALSHTARRFIATYGMRSIDPYRGNTPIQFIAAFFAGIADMPKDEYIRVMNGAGKELLRMGIDCRTPAEIVRHQLHQIKAGHTEIV